MIAETRNTLRESREEHANVLHMCWMSQHHRGVKLEGRGNQKRIGVSGLQNALPEQVLGG